ncbi:hypothetical protein IFM89_013883 [Coptis chinensis]|uniref:Uncharacterized protein n=1 Tax=Coptis chinensis TaxID=261450 RepID=A0A835HD02_9MAGN|nr:hypothetical protein IFM89_013883 [Coptis chinensis]
MQFSHDEEISSSPLTDKLSVLSFLEALDDSVAKVSDSDDTELPSQMPSGSDAMEAGGKGLWAFIWRSHAGIAGWLMCMFLVDILLDYKREKRILEEGNGVVSSCLNCFLSGGILYRFEYEVGPALFLAKARGGTCTLAVSDPDNVDFAIYCKTGLLVVEQGILGQSGQVVSIVGGPLAAVLSTPLRLVTANVYGMVAMGVGVYSLLC